MNATGPTAPPPLGIDASPFPRIIADGFGRKAWHVPEMKAAVVDVTSDHAFWRAAPGRHNIAEIGLHQAYWIHKVREQISGVSEPFALPGEDWIALHDASAISWPNVLKRQNWSKIGLSRSAPTSPPAGSCPHHPNRNASIGLPASLAMPFTTHKPLRSA